MDLCIFRVKTHEYEANKSGDGFGFFFVSFWKNTHTKMFLIEHRPSSPFPRKKHILKTKLEMIISEYIKIFIWNKLFSQWHYFTFELLILSHKLVNIYCTWTDADTTHGRISQYKPPWCFKLPLSFLFQWHSSVLRFFLQL